MALLHPGVYVQEVSSGVRPIEGVSTSNAAFIGKAQKGPVSAATLITAPSQFDTEFGDYLADSWLAHAVHQFFNNGGTACYIVRVTGAGAATAAITLKDRRGAPGSTLEIQASSPGAWANVLDIVITDGTLDSSNEFNLAVYMDHSGENPPQPPELLESFEDLSIDPSSSDYVESRINQNSKYITVTVDPANLANAAQGTSRSAKLPVGSGASDLKLVTGVAGGGTATAGTAGPPPTAGTLRSGDTPSTDPAADRRRLTINLNGDGPQEVLIPGDASTGPAIAAAIQTVVTGMTAKTAANQPAYAGFTASYQTPGGGAAPFYLLTSGTAGATSSVAVNEVMVLNGGGAALLGLGVAHGGTETAGSAGPPATNGESKSAPGPATNIPADSRRFMINLDGDGPQEVVFAPATATGADVATSIQSVVRALVPKNAGNAAAYTGFTAEFVNPGGGAANFYRLHSGTTGVNSSVVVTDSMKPAAGIALPAGLRRFMIDVNSDGSHIVDLNGPLADGNAVATAIQAAVRAIVPKRNSNAAAFAAFTASYDTSAGVGNPSLLLTSGKQGANSSVRVTNFSSLALNGASLLGLGLTNGGDEISGTAVLRPANSQNPTEYHLGDAIVAGNVASVVLGDDGIPPGDLEHKNGLNALDTINDVNLIAIPGIGSQDVVSTGVNYCTVRADCFFIGDMNSTDDTVDEAVAFVNGLAVKSSYGAVYYPWLKVADPTGQSATPILEPPSGFVAGMMARIDSRRGVWKAPAGTEANIGGALGLSALTTDTQQDFLNPVGVNVIRSFPASGIVIWGARTLATRSDPEYRYIPVRRTAIFLEQSIYQGIQFAVFEPNDEPLWSSLRLNITAFMTNLFRQGAFQGRSASDAFLVMCDSTTTTQQDIDAGVVNIIVAFAPLKPAEFVVLKLTQKAGAPA